MMVCFTRQTVQTKIKLQSDLGLFCLFMHLFLKVRNITVVDFVLLQLGAIYKACDGSNVRRAMFSATFAFDVEEWCKLNLDNVVQVYIGAR